MSWSKTWPAEYGFYWLRTKYLPDPEVVRVDRGLISIAGSEQTYYPEETAEFFYPKLEIPKYGN